MKMNIVRKTRISVAGVLVMAVACCAAAALVHSTLVSANAAYAPAHTPGGGHTGYSYTVNGLTPGSTYTLVTDGSALKIESFYAMNPAKTVQLPTSSGTHSVVSYGDTICFYGPAPQAVNSSIVSK